MTAGNFNACLTEVLEMEGGYVDDPAGGPTNLGVTLPALQHWYGTGRVATVQDIKDLTPEAVAPLYHAGFWAASHCDFLPVGIDLFVFDEGVNEGPGTANRHLQEALGITVDGLVGPMTINAALAAPAGRLIDKMAEVRIAYYRTLPGFDSFGQGWLNRVANVSARAKTMETVK